MRDLTLRELVTVVPLLVLSLFLGLHPRPVIERSEPTMRTYVEHFERITDYREPEFAGPSGSESTPPGGASGDAPADAPERDGSERPDDPASLGGGEQP
jgi:hypothetical protein